MTAPDLSLLGTVRTDWTLEQARAIYTAPFSDLLFHAQRVHRDHFVPNQVLDTIVDEGVTTGLLVPAMLGILGHRVNALTLRSLRTALTAARRK